MVPVLAKVAVEDANVEARLVDDVMVDVAPGDVGEIVYRGPTVFQGYWNDPAATADRAPLSRLAEAVGLARALNLTVTRSEIVPLRSSSVSAAASASGPATVKPEEMTPDGPCTSARQ